MFERRGIGPGELALLFSSSFRHSPVGMALLDGEGRVVAQNAALAPLLQRTEDELHATPIIPVLDVDGQAADLRSVLNGERPSAQVEVELCANGGPAAVCASLFAPATWEQASGGSEPSSPPFFCLQVVDISTQRKVEEALRRSEEHFRLLTENAKDVISRYRLVPKVGLEYISPSIKALTGYDPEDFYRDPQMYKRVLSPEDRPRLDRAAETGFPDPQLIRLRRKDGGEVWVELRTVPIYDEEGMLVAVESVARDVTDRQAFQTELARRALHDSLTGLPNRGLLLDRLALARARAERRGSAVAVLFLDLDRFKVINDSLGHDVGDRVLDAVARRLATAVRPLDTVARLGGDEFVVLCEDLTSDHEASAVADRIGRQLSRPFDLDGQELFLTASIGIAIGTGSASTAENLLRDAEGAMYRAKERGRSRAELFDESLRRRALTRLEVETALRRALERGELEVMYQPEISITDGEIVAAEALVRWRHPSRGLLPPAEFIPVAEETGLVVPLGEYVLEEACKQAAHWHELAGHPVAVGVNLSGRQLDQPELCEVVEESIRKSGIEPSALCLEITEGVLMEDAEGAKQRLEALKELGVKVSIDDFGTGYSSLAYLRRFPVDVLKVDRSFVDGLGADPEDSAIVAAVVGLASTLGLGVAAEGVETREQLVELTSLGCDLAQGFYFSPPVPADEFDDLLGGRVIELP